MASKEVAAGKNVGFVDAYGAVMDAAKSDEDRRRFYSDGLHLTAQGYEVCDYMILKKKERNEKTPAG